MVLMHEKPSAAKTIRI